MNRRRFIYNSSIASLSVLGLNSCSQLLRDVKITILHSNDVHSQIEPFPLNHDRFPNRGGFARRASIFDGVRSVNPNTLIFDAGDIFQGTPYFNFFKGELELKIIIEKVSQSENFQLPKYHSENSSGLDIVADIKDPVNLNQKARQKRDR